MATKESTLPNKEITLPRLTQAVDRGNLITTVIKLYGYTVVQQSLIETSSNAELHTFLSIDGELFHVCSPVFKIEDESRSWKLKFEEYNEVKGRTGLEEISSMSLRDIRLQTSKVDVTGDPEGSQLRQLCQRGILEDIQCILKDSKSCNVLISLCDVPYPRPEDLCDKALSNMLLNLQHVKKVLVVHPKVEAEICGEESGLEGTWSRYLATDMACLMWKREEGHFMVFEKKYLKQVMKNGLHEVKKKEQNSLKRVQNSLKRENNTLKKDETSLTKAATSLKNEQISSQEQDLPQKEETPAKKDPKPFKTDSLKKDAKPAKPVKPVKPAKPDSLKRGESRSSIIKKESPKSTLSRRISKSDVKATKPDVKATKPDVKPTKPEKKPIKTEQKSVKGDQKPAKADEKAATKNSKKTTKTDLPVNGEIVVSETKTGSPVQPPSTFSIFLEIFSQPIFRGFFLVPVLFAFYFLSSESVASILLIAASVWFKYGSKKPEFQKYARSGDERVLAFRRIYEREIEKMRYAKDLRRMRSVHLELKESVLNAYAVNRVSSGDLIGVEDHEELERELELTFKEFVTEVDVKNLLNEVHYSSILLSFTIFLYLMSRIVYVALARVWRPVRTVPVIAAAILLSLALCVISNFLSMSLITARLVGFAEMFCLAFGIWLVTDVTGVLIEIRACIDHVTGVVWREVDLERCIVKSPSHLVVKLALDCAVILSFFPLVYTSSWVLSMFSVSDGTIDFVGRYFPPGVIILRLCSRLAFFGEILRLANLIMFTCLASKLYGLYKTKGDPLDELLYNLFGYDFGSLTEYIWKPTVKYLNDLN